LSQHDVLPLEPNGQETPVDVICGIVTDGIEEGSIIRADAEALAHIVIGAIVLNVQAHVYGRQKTPLTTLTDTIANAILGGIAKQEA